MIFAVFDPSSLTVCINCSLGDRVKRFALRYRTVICLWVLSCLFCLKRWCIVAIRLDGSRWNLACNDASRPRPWPHCVRWGPRSTSPKGAQPPISAHICCGQMARWIKMLLGTKIGLGPGRIVLHGHPATPFNRGSAPNFRQMYVVAKRSPISATAEHLFTCIYLMFYYLI